MKFQVALLLSSLLLLFSVTNAGAAQDYNSSRSNKSAAIVVPDETEELLRLAAEDAVSVMRTMQAQDGRDGYRGDYHINVEVKVTLERAPSPADSRRVRP